MDQQPKTSSKTRTNNQRKLEKALDSLNEETKLNSFMSLARSDRT